MIYEASHGVVRQPPARVVTGAALSLPILAAAILFLGVFSSHSFGAAGKRPQVATKKSSLNLSLKPASSPTRSAPSAGTSASGASDSSVVSTPPSGTAPVSSGSVASTSGRGGGLLPAGTGSTDTSTTSSSADLLLPATVTIPPTDVQAAGKQIVSTNNTSVTLN